MSDSSETKENFLPDFPMCPKWWFNREGWFMLFNHIVCYDFDCFCDICYDYKVELLD